MGQSTRRLLGNFLGFLAVLFAAVSTPIATLVVCIIVLAIWGFSWLKGILVLFVFFVVWKWGVFFLSILLMGLSQSLLDKNHQQGQE